VVVQVVLEKIQVVLLRQVVLGAEVVQLEVLVVQPEELTPEAEVVEDQNIQELHIIMVLLVVQESLL
jgi:hypothetical protein